MSDHLDHHPFEAILARHLNEQASDVEEIERDVNEGQWVHSLHKEFWLTAVSCVFTRALLFVRALMMKFTLRRGAIITRLSAYKR